MTDVLSIACFERHRIVSQCSRQCVVDCPVLRGLKALLANGDHFEHRLLDWKDSGKPQHSDKKLRYAKDLESRWQ